MDGSRDRVAADGARGRRSRDSRRVKPLRGGLRVLGLGAIASVVIVAASVVIHQPVTATHRRAVQIVRQDLPLQLESAKLRDALVAWQLFLEPMLDQSQTGAPFAPVDISKGGQLSQAQGDQAKALSAALRSRGLRGEAGHLDVAMKNLSAAITNLAPAVTGSDLTPTKRATIVAAERSVFAAVWGVTSPLSGLITQRTASDAQLAADKSGLALSVTVAAGAVLVLLTLGATIAFALRVLRRQRKDRSDARRQVFGTELQEALEFTDTETAVYSIVGQALHDAVPDLNVELLIADSSRAHFSRVLTSHDDPELTEGCGVVSPRDCPAAKRAHTLTFTSSDALNACPYLKDRASGSCSAACIPVSIAGQAVGVMHATGANGIPPTIGDIEKMELSTRRAAERVALIRTFETSETQAHTDPLTGLLNRRSLENRVRELQSDGIPYALAYGDLDFFKTLNDTHGHEAGDQALRLFSRVMRDSVRPADPRLTIRQRRIRDRAPRLHHRHRHHRARTRTRTPRPDAHQRSSSHIHRQLRPCVFRRRGHIRRNCRHRRPSPPRRQSRRPQPCPSRHPTNNRRPPSADTTHLRTARNGVPLGRSCRNTRRFASVARLTVDPLKPTTGDTGGRPRF